MFDCNLLIAFLQASYTYEVENGNKYVVYISGMLQLSLPVQYFLIDKYYPYLCHPYDAYHQRPSIGERAGFFETRPTALEDESSNPRWFVSMCLFLG